MRTPKIIFALCCLAIAANASAERQTAQLLGYVPYEVDGKQVMLVQLQTNVSGGCNTTGRFAIDSSVARFKGSQAAIIAAFHSQTKVTIEYSRTCNAFGNAWDITYVCIGDIAC